MARRTTRKRRICMAEVALVAAGSTNVRVCGNPAFLRCGGLDYCAYHAGAYEEARR